MSLWEAFLLGIIQGIAEFLPVSSSGHLILAQYLFGLDNLEQFVFFDLVCHMGTLIAVFVIFFDEIKKTCGNIQKISQYAVAILPLFFLVPFNKKIKELFDHPELLGYAFLITAFILFIGDRFAKKTQPLNIKSAFLIGVAQMLAIIPGISRSGTTISTGKILGLPPYQAVVFSFLLSIPTILGGMALELLKPQNHLSLPITIYFAGFFSSLIVGYFSLRLLIRIVGTAKFRYFSWYLIILGISVIYFFN